MREEACGDWETEDRSMKRVGEGAKGRSKEEALGTRAQGERIGLLGKSGPWVGSGVGAEGEAEAGPLPRGGESKLCGPRSVVTR